MTGFFLFCSPSEMTVFLFVSQVSDYPGGIAVVYGGFSRLVSQFITHGFYPTTVEARDLVVLGSSPGQWGRCCIVLGQDTLLS